MISGGRVQLSVLALVGVIAFVGTGGAVAGTAITGANIKNNTITGADIKDHSLAGKELNATTVGNLEGDRGPKGERGDTGPAGPGAKRLHYSTPINQTSNIASANGFTFIGTCAVSLGGYIQVTLRAEGPVFRMYGVTTHVQGGIGTTPTVTSNDFASDQFGRRDLTNVSVIYDGSSSQTAATDGTLTLVTASTTTTVIFRAQVLLANLDSRCTIEGTVIPSI